MEHEKKTGMSTQEWVKHMAVKVAERELEELRVVGQALNSEVKQLELFLASVYTFSTNLVTVRSRFRFCTLLYSRSAFVL